MGWCHQLKNIDAPAEMLVWRSGVCVCVYITLDDHPAVVEVDQEAVEQREEHVTDVTDHHHLGLGQAGLDVVEVQHLVLVHKTHTHHRVCLWILPGG